MDTINTFLKEEDYDLVSYIALRKVFETIYCDLFSKKPETFGSKFKNQSKIHWSRDWEYPWAIINSRVKKGERVLDCGCGGSPLLPFLYQFGCDAYGIDPAIFKTMSLTNYYSDLVKRAIKKFKNKKMDSLACKSADGQAQAPQTNSFWDRYKYLLGLLKRPSNDLWRFHRNPDTLGFRIKYFSESVDKMHFENNYFDKVFCISVIEHLPTDAAFRGMKEMARVLKRGGLLVVTVDNDGHHVNPDLVNSYEKLIRATGLTLHGLSDFRKPTPENIPGTYNVVGFILEK